MGQKMNQPSMGTIVVFRRPRHAYLPLIQLGSPPLESTHVLFYNLPASCNSLVKAYSNGQWKRKVGWIQQLTSVRFLNVHSQLPH